MQDFNEQIDDADLDGDGKIGKVAKQAIIVYYILNNIGVIFGFTLIVIGLVKGIDKEQIESAIKMLQMVL